MAMSGAERARRYRARRRGEDVPKLRRGRKTDHLDRAIGCLLAAVEHINQLPAVDLERLKK